MKGLGLEDGQDIEYDDHITNENIDYNIDQYQSDEEGNDELNEMNNSHHNKQKQRNWKIPMITRGRSGNRKQSNGIQQHSYLSGFMNQQNNKRNMNKDSQLNDNDEDQSNESLNLSSNEDYQKYQHRHKKHHHQHHKHHLKHNNLIQLDQSKRNNQIHNESLSSSSSSSSLSTLGKLARFLLTGIDSETSSDSSLTQSIHKSHSHKHNKNNTKENHIQQSLQQSLVLPQSSSSSSLLQPNTTNQQTIQQSKNNNRKQKSILALQQDSIAPPEQPLILIPQQQTSQQQILLSNQQQQLTQYKPSDHPLSKDGHFICSCSCHQIPSDIQLIEQIIKIILMMPDGGCPIKYCEMEEVVMENGIYTNPNEMNNKMTSIVDQQGILMNQDKENEIQIQSLQDQQQNTNIMNDSNINQIPFISLNESSSTPNEQNQFQPSINFNSNSSQSFPQQTSFQTNQQTQIDLIQQPQVSLSPQQQLIPDQLQPQNQQLQQQEHIHFDFNNLQSQQILDLQKENKDQDLQQQEQQPEQMKIPFRISLFDMRRQLEQHFGCSLIDQSELIRTIVFDIIDEVNRPTKSRLQAKINDLDALKYNVYSRVQRVRKNKTLDKDFVTNFEEERKVMRSISMTSRTGPRQKHKQSISKQHKSGSTTSAVNPTRSTNIRTKQNKSSTAPKKEIQIVDPVSQDGESKAESGASSIIFDLDESIEEGSIDQMSFSGLSVDFDD